MTETDKTLHRLVALRRQKAEQAMALITSEIRQDEAALADLEAQLGRLDQSAEDYATFSLSMRYGRPGQIQEQIGRLKNSLNARRKKLEAAKLTLKKALHSEDRLQDIAGGR